jgi:hypothetical protein
MMPVYLVENNECIMKTTCRNYGRKFACRKPKKNSKFITCYNFLENC